MNSYLRSSVYLLLGFLLCVYSTSNAQKKDKILSKAQQLLKGYTPPLEKKVPPNETPDQAWRRSYEEKYTHKMPGSNSYVEPSANQYHKRGLGEAIRKQLAESKRTLTNADIKQRMNDAIREEERAGRGEAWELQKKGIHVARQSTPDEMRKSLDERVNQDEQKQGVMHGTPSTQEVRRLIEEHMLKNPVSDKGDARKISGVVGNGLFSGTVYNDLNRNGVRDSLEPGIGEVTVSVWEYNTSRSLSTVTDSLGNYSFIDSVGSGTYYVYEPQPTGWYLTSNFNGYPYVNVNGDSVTGRDFGYWKIPPRSFSGVKFSDLNHNGARDTLEPALKGWVIHLYEYNTEYTYTDTTDSLGRYHFDSLMQVGYYNIYEENRTGWLQTLPSGNGNYYQRYLFDTSFSHLDFGNWFMPPIAIEGMKFSDLNGNGVKDVGEPGIPGWTINILRQSPYMYFSVVTDANGLYTFIDSGYASYYQIYESNQDGWLVTYPYRSQGAYYYPYLAGDTITNQDFGNWLVPLGSIRGTKFNDINNNGTWDNGEPGLAGWVIHAYNEDTGDTLTTVTDSLGRYSFDSLSWVHYYRVFENQQLDWIKTFPGGDYWRPYVAGDTAEGVNFGNYLPPQGSLRVNTMPSNSVSVTYANAIAGSPVTVWGNVHGGMVPLHYYLDYGDGTMDSGIVTNRRFIGSAHAYASAGPKVMSLKVVDANDSSDVDESVIRVYAASSPQIRTNMAIEKGLLYFYLSQYPDGHWNDNEDYVASTGAALLSFEENGHKPSNDINTDIYAEYVRLGLNYLFGGARTYSIYAQTAGNPDVNGNGLGAYLVDNTYANGIGLLAVLGAYADAAGAQSDTIRVGPYSGKTFYDFMVDAVDQWAFSQTDSGNSDRGGWRYGVATPDYGSSDNSTTQWAALDLEAAQTWGIFAPPFVKSELQMFLQNSQAQNGGFFYSTLMIQYWTNITKTAAAIGSYAYLGATTSTPAVDTALGFINDQWDLKGSDVYGWDQHLSGNTYAMYAVAKAMRIINHRGGNQFVGVHDWYVEYVTHLLDDPSWKQNDDGSWPRSGNYPTGAMGDPLNSSLAILVLTRGVVVQPPVAGISPLGAFPPNTPFAVDGSSSFHQDPNKSIVEWLWIWNIAGGLNWNRPDASGPRPNNPGYADTGVYTLALRVKDNSNPPLYSIATANVHITLAHHPPVAVAIPPNRGSTYAGKVGEPIFLDGRESYSPDYPKDSVVAWRWDLNGNGTYYDTSDASTDTVTVIFHDPYRGQVGLRVYDTHGDSSSNTAYINIAAARTDLYVREFKVSPDTILQGQTLQLFAVVGNNDSSNTGASHVLVRFYDDDPLTVGNQLGGDSYVDLPVSAIETVQTPVTPPVRFRAGLRHIYVFLDANEQVAEWNELNNLASEDVEVLAIHPVSVYDRNCLSFATVPVHDSLTLPLTIMNTGNDSLFIDSLVTRNPAFSYLNGESDTVIPGNSLTLYVRFIPGQEGNYNDSLVVYSNDKRHAVSLQGQGELHATGSGGQVFWGLATIDGNVAPAYTVVGAYKKNGDLIRAFLIQMPPESVRLSGFNYVVNIGDGQAGVASGDSIFFKVATLGCDVMPDRYCAPQIVFQPAIPPDSVRHDVDGVHQRSITIPLLSVYNSISWNVKPSDPKVTSVFGNILATGKVKIILDYMNNGQENPQFEFYIPQLGNYNPLQWTDLTKGYFIKFVPDVSPDSLVVSGVPVCPTIPIPLEGGYNLVAYLPESRDSVTHALGSLKAGNLVDALDWNTSGQYYDFYPTGSFTGMSPTKGYFVNVDSSDVLIYPATPASAKLSAHAKVATNGGYKKVSSLGSGIPSAVFAFGLHVNIDGNPVLAGTDIKAVDKDGVVCGSAKFVADGVFALPIYGDDPSTPKDEGASPAEMVNIYIDNKLVTQQVRWTELGDTPELEGNLSVTAVTLGKGVPREYVLHQNYPNPFNPTTSIGYDLPKASNVALKIYDMLGAEVRTLVNESQTTGYYQVVWDGRNDAGAFVASGIYTYRLVAASEQQTFVQTRKMVFMK